ncbi:MAG: hypothetical protein PHD70_13545 [Anaerostipes sp.]|nr:hypothetical protein [Anaerostipes sp.]
MKSSENTHYMPLVCIFTLGYDWLDLSVEEVLKKDLAFIQGL